jgi:NADH-quinone oxidoreductase subunit J
MANQIVFAILATIIVASAIYSVATKSIMRAATALLVVLFGVAGMYFLLDYTFLGAVQISIYAGGITMIYIFAIQLVSKRTLQGLQERLKGSKVIAGCLAALAGIVTVLAVVMKYQFIDMFQQLPDKEIEMSVIGNTLMGAGKYQYVLPFEFISLFLLACIIGGLVILNNKKEENK